MKTQQTEFKAQIKCIREEALNIGFSICTMDGYLKIWNKFILWKNENNFIYAEEDYVKFLFDYYNFDVSTYSSNSKSRHQQYMRSKRILDNFDEYKLFMQKRALPNALYSEYPGEWNVVLDKYLNYLSNVRCNAKNSIKAKKDYLIRLLSYFYQNKITRLNDITKSNVINFINDTVDSGSISKRRNFYVLRDFLNYLFIEDILIEDLSIYVPTIKGNRRIKLPTYFKQNEVDVILNSIPRTTKVGIRDYNIILIAARLGLRINDILNIKIKDIDWKNNKLIVNQLKNHNLNTLPLSKEVGWAIIDYIKNSRPKCKNEYLFVKSKYPFEKMEHFSQYSKYFEKTNIELEESHQGGIHCLRHSFATNLLENEVPIDIIASSLGDTIETTTKTYLKVDKKGLKGCALEVEEDGL